MRRLLILAFMITFISCNQNAPSTKKELPMEKTKTAVRYQTKKIQGLNIA